MRLWCRPMKSTKAGLLVCVSASLMLAGCQTTKTPSAATSTASFCKVAEPIFYSRTDSPDTRKQIREHNAVGIALCNWGTK